jgi:hypothetical protein
MIILLINLIILFFLWINISIFCSCCYRILFFRDLRNSGDYHGSFALEFILLIVTLTIIPFVLFAFVSTAVHYSGETTFTSNTFVPIDRDTLEQTKIFLAAKDLHDDNLLLTNRRFISDVLIYRTALTSLADLFSTVSLPLPPQFQFVDFCLHYYNTSYLLLFKNHYLAQFFFSLWVKIFCIGLNKTKITTEVVFPLMDHDSLIFFFRYAEIVVNPQYYVKLI